MKTHSPHAGFSLPALIFFMTAASIFIAAAVPVYQMQAKRDAEEELIFRGGEYTRAIQKYQRKFGVYPTSIDQLVSTNGLRFLRKAYKDPITGKDFRLLLINPDGSLTGSKVFTQNITNQSIFGNTQPFGGGQNNQQQQQQQQQQPQQQISQQTGLQPFGGQQGFQSPQNSQQSQTQFNQFGSQQQNSQQPGAFRVGGGIAPPAGGLGGFTQSPQQSQPQRGFQQGLRNTPGTPGGQPVAGGGIVGVASDSHKDSIKIYNNRQKYDEWDFVAILNQGTPGQPGQPGQPGVPGATGTQQPNPFGNGQRPTSPFGTPSSSPFGGAPTTSPFGTNQTQAPFGTNQTPQPTPFGVPNTPAVPQK
jgi:type II secretory pathway pseudopilin PulG